MADDDIIAKRLGGISTELAKLPAAINKLLESEDGKKYFDEGLGEIIKDGVLTIAAKFSEKEAGENYYHNEMVEAVKSSFSEAIEKIGRIRLDMSPIFKMASDINADNKKILDAILNQPKPETNDFKYQELLMTMQKTNELLMLMLNKKEVPVIDMKTKREIESYEFNHKREYDRIVSTTVIPKYKN